MRFTNQAPIPHHARTSASRTAGALLVALALAACGGGDDRPWTGGGDPPWSGKNWNWSEATGWAAPDGTEGYRWVEGQGWVYWSSRGGSGEDPQTVVCKGRDGKDMPVKPKTITIYNNSDDVIYPAIETSRNEVNEWLQGCWRTAQAYPTRFVYKAYVNEGRGLLPNTSVTLTLPLMSQLDQERYITWWNGGRVILADKSERLRDPNDRNIGVVANVSCEAQGTDCALTIYEAASGVPEDAYAQLSEYTFGDSVPITGEPRWFKPENVGYNISYVDHVYMPVAIGPKDNPYIGYSGSVQALPVFREKIDAFLSGASGKGWPLYNLFGRKLPGAYNAFAARGGTRDRADNVPVKPAEGDPPVLTVLRCIDGGCTDEEKKTVHFGAALQQVQNLWGSCVSWEGEDISAYVTERITCPGELQTDMKLVKQFFEQNHRNYVDGWYRDKTCTALDPDKNPGPRTPKFLFLDALAHIYGWVQFNNGCSAATNPLIKTEIPGWNHARIQEIYIDDLQYNYRKPYFRDNPKLAFNPYVHLIHEDLEMNAYGFSVDDAVGFMSELGTGLIFAVGGTRGLENPRQFNYANGFELKVGVPQAVVGKDVQLIKRYGVCSLGSEPNDPDCTQDRQDVTMPEQRLIAGFRVGTVPSYPARVRFTDTHDNVYSIDIKKKFPRCDFAAGSDTCYPDRAQLYDATACKVTNSEGELHPESKAWCASADAHEKRERKDKDVSGSSGQVIKNYIAFATLLDS